MNKIIVSSFVAFVLCGASVASAQTFYPPFVSATYAGVCTNLSGDLSFGSRGSEVSRLQTFLVTQNFPGSGSWMITGNFRSATLAAVRNFQQAQGLPITGMVGGATRAAISRVSCGGYSGYSNAYPYTTPFNYSYQNNTNCYYTYPYTCNNFYNYNNVTLSSLSVTTGLPGTSVTIYGSGFDYLNNTIYFGSTPIANVSSPNGTSLTFTVPHVTAGTVGVYVTNSRGTSSTLNFNVIGGNCTTQYYNCCPTTQSPLQYVQGQGYVFGYQSQNQYGYPYCYPQTSAPTISSVNGPTSLSIGTLGTWTLTVNNQNNSYMTTSVNWGDAGGYASAAPQTTYQQGSNTLTFTHTYYAAGTYTVTFTVTNTSGQSNTSTATVSVGGGSGQYGNVTLSSISPMSGRVGTQIVLTGNGFSSLDNTVHFGIGGTQHVPSQNGTTMYFTIPSYVSPCDVVTQGNVCAQYVQQVVPGPIQVYVRNSSGTTNTILFNVTN